MGATSVSTAQRRVNHHAEEFGALMFGARGAEKRGETIVDITRNLTLYPQTGSALGRAALGPRTVRSKYRALQATYTAARLL